MPWFEVENDQDQTDFSDSLCSSVLKEITDSIWFYLYSMLFTATATASSISLQAAFSSQSAFDPSKSMNSLAIFHHLAA